MSKRYGQNATDQWTHQQNWHNNPPDIDEELQWELKTEAVGWGWQGGGRGTEGGRSNWRMEHHNKVGSMVTVVLWCEEERLMVGRENGDDVGFETPLSSDHIGIGTKLWCKFEISVAHNIFLSSQQHGEHN